MKKFINLFVMFMLIFASVFFISCKQNHDQTVRVTGIKLYASRTSTIMTDGTDTTEKEEINVHKRNQRLHLLYLNAKVYPENASNKNITWETDNAEVIDIHKGIKTEYHKKAFIQHINSKPGDTCKITVKTEDGGFTATCNVTIVPVEVTGVKLNKNEFPLSIGASETLIANVTPSDATNKKVSWSSDNKNVAEVDENGNVTVTTTEKEKSCKITVTTEDGSFSDHCIIFVDAVRVTGLTLLEENLELKRGEEKQLTATITPENATHKTLRWDVNSTYRGTITQDGKITVKENATTGYITITVKTEDGNFEKTCLVKVVQ